MKRFPIALTVAAVTLLSATAGFATEQQPAQQGGVKITGTVDFNSYNYNNTNYASGSNNEAIQSNGSIVGDVDISGTLNFTSTNYDNTNYASGSDNRAVQLNGSIVGANPFAE